MRVFGAQEQTDSRDPAAWPRVVVVGAGFGGAALLRNLRDQPVRLQVIDKRNHHLFQPLLYQVACAGLSAEDITIPVRSLIRGRKNVTVMLDEVTGVDRARREVITRNGRWPYDTLVLATGMRNFFFGQESWQQHALGLKDLDDALEIRRRVLLAFEKAEMCADLKTRRKLMTFVLIGAGPTGVEMAGALAELARFTLRRDFTTIRPASARIVLLEAAPETLPGMPRELGAAARRALHRLGVEVRVDCKVEDIQNERVIACGGETLEAGTIIWTAGVQATPVTQWLGVEGDEKGRVRVTPQLTLPDDDRVYVIGDAARVEDASKTPLPGLAAVAKQQGEYVAEALARRVRGERMEAPFQYRDRGELATVGRSAAVADLGKVKLKGFLAWLMWGLVHIFYLSGFENRLRVFVSWFWSYLTFAKGARLIVNGNRRAKTGSSPPQDRRSPERASVDEEKP